MIKLKQTTSFFFNCLAAVSLFSLVISCSKPVVGENDYAYNNFPSTPVPDELRGGIWFWGNIGPIAYFDRDGHQVGNGTEAARDFIFSGAGGKGRYEFTQYLGTRTASNCVTEIYTNKMGTVVFEGTDRLIIHPVEGSFKTVKKGCGGSDGTTTRKATADELKVESFLWALKTVSGEKLFYIYDVSDKEKLNPLFVYSFSN